MKRSDTATAADVTDAELAIARLNAQASTLADSEAVARLLLRAEAVASSKIEGLEVGGRRLLKAQLAQGLDDGRPDITATEGRQQHRGDELGGRDAQYTSEHHRGRPSRGPRTAARRHATRGARRTASRLPELDRRERLQPLFSRLRPSPAPARARPARRPINSWISFFAGVCRRAVSDAEAFERRVSELQDDWRARLGSVRKNSAIDLLQDALPGAAIMTVQSGAALVGRSVQAVNEAIPRLVDAGVLTQTTVGKRNRAFEAKELIDSFHGTRTATRKP